MTPTDQETIDAFHKLFYQQQRVYWNGYEMLKNIMDLWQYQQIIYDMRPDLIVECGTWKGGSALYLATICDMVDHGLIATVDINQWAGSPRHDRITYIQGDSGSKEVSDLLHGISESFNRVMLILDSDHVKPHVLKELRNLWDIVTPGHYLIVEDGNIHGHPVREDYPEGPTEALEEFLSENDHFIQDRGMERFMVTFNPGGYLRRIK